MTIPDTKLGHVEREILTPMTDDGVYYILEPTLCQDHGPNYKEKIYNDIRLNYKQDKNKGIIHNYSEAKCIINIPHVIVEKKRKRRTAVRQTQRTPQELSIGASTADRQKSPYRKKDTTQSERNTLINVQDESVQQQHISIQSPTNIVKTGGDDHQLQTPLKNNFDQTAFASPNNPNFTVDPDVQNKFEEMRSYTDNCESIMNEEDEIEQLLQ